MARWRERIALWTWRRQGPDDAGFRLHRRRLYIVPTRLGFAYGGVLFAMLVGGLNYGSNPALLFTFLLAAAAWVAMHQAHANLAGLEGRVEGLACSTDPQGPVEWHLTLRAPAASWRPGLEIDGPLRPGITPLVVCVEPGQEFHAIWRQPATPGLRRIRLATRHPLGLFRAWTWIHPPAPRPPVCLEATGIRPMPREAPEQGHDVDAAGDIVGLRPWRPGEAVRRVAWRASARLRRLVLLERAREAPGAELLPPARPRFLAGTVTPGTPDRRALGLALAALAAAGLLQLGRVPWLVGLALPTAVMWRWQVARRGWSMPPRWLKLLLAVGAAIAVFLAFRTWNGLAAGSALLVTMAALKLLETRDRRDLAVVGLLAAFLAYAAVLGDSDPTTLGLGLGVALLMVAALATREGGDHVNHRSLLRQTAHLLLWSLPLAVLLFLFVPRIDGQFWSLPSDGRARSGLGDEMRPGDISELSLSDEPVMRVFFTGAVPPGNQRYWRGPVLHDFDGSTWRASRGTPYPQARVEPRGIAVEYRVLLEPTQRTYLPVLERGLAWSLPRARRDWDLGVLVERPITGAIAYEARSDPAAVVAGPLPLSLRRRALQWPEGTNPRTLAWAKELRRSHADDAALVGAVLRRFGEAPFAYTLTPPRLDEVDAVDDFLFRSRRGFCGHYASALAAVARAAGIPARVVTGYQGGEWNRIGGYLLVRQSAAHAWNEIWLDGQGWVRVDPTAAVAPERVESGLDDALGLDEPVPGRLYGRWPWLGQARAWVDAARTAWQNRFLRFDRSAQEQLAARLGFGDRGLASLVRALVVLMALAGLALLVFTLRESGWRWPSRAERRWRRVCRQATRRGCPRHPAEGESTYAERVAATCPSLATAIRAAARDYIAERYRAWG